MQSGPELHSVLEYVAVILLSHSLAYFIATGIAHIGYIYTFTLGGGGGTRGFSFYLTLNKSNKLSAIPKIYF